MDEIRASASSGDKSEQRVGMTDLGCCVPDGLNAEGILLVAAAALLLLGLVVLA